MAQNNKARKARIARHARVRKRVTGSTSRPRLSVFRSLQHIYAQVIDDSAGFTLASASTVDNEVRGLCDGMAKTQEAEVVGRVIAERALACGITQVVFDRGGNRYHGRVKALANAARKAGLDF